MNLYRGKYTELSIYANFCLSICNFGIFFELIITTILKFHLNVDHTGM